MAAYAHEEALAYFHRALDAKERQPIDDDTAAILYGLGRARTPLLLRDEARECLSLAFEYYQKVGNVDRAVEVADHELTPTVHITRALELAPLDSQQEGRLLGRDGHALNFNEQNSGGDYEGAQKAFARALYLAQRQGDVVLEA